MGAAAPPPGTARGALRGRSCSGDVAPRLAAGCPQPGSRPAAELQKRWYQAREAARAQLDALGKGGASPLYSERL